MSETTTKTIGEQNEFCLAVESTLGFNKQGYYWYNYRCSPSTETRGANKSQGKGCGHPMLRKSKQNLELTGAKIQGVRCPNCDNRKRFGWGDCHQNKTDAGLAKVIFDDRLNEWRGENEQ